MAAWDELEKSRRAQAEFFKTQEAKAEREAAGNSEVQTVEDATERMKGVVFDALAKSAAGSGDKYEIADAIERVSSELIAQTVAERVQAEFSVRHATLALQREEAHLQGLDLQLTVYEGAERALLMVCKGVERAKAKESVHGDC